MTMEFNNEQKQAITSLKPLVLVSAGAGSGKTRILTERVVYLCELHLTDPAHEAGATVEEMVAITFTEKAAREMRERIRARLAEKEKEALEEKARLYWKEQKDALEHAYISTFHSFCQRLLKQHAMAANLIPHMRLLDEMEASKKKRKILQELFTDPTFVEAALPLFDCISKHQLSTSLVDIHDFIREHVIGEEAIMALDPEKMLAQQWMEKGKRQLELVQRFHREAVRCVAAFPTSKLTPAQQKHVDKISALFETLAEPTDAHSYMAQLLEIMPSRSDKRWEEAVPSLYELYTEYWKPLKDRWQGDDTKDIDHKTKMYMETFIQLLKKFATRYQEDKERSGELDFSDLQQKAVTLLSNESIQQMCRRQFRHMMVDEFQDTNILQLTMLERIDPNYRFIVGDQKQSIYRFRGANVRLMNEQEALAQKEEWADAILMNTNYRTQTKIIEVVNELFSYAMAKERTHAYETVYAPLHAHRSSDDGKCVELTILPKDEERERNQYEVLASRIVQMIKTGTPRVQKDDKWVKPSWSDIAILISTRSHLLLLERALNDAQIPYVISGGIGFFERQEVVDYMTLLRWLSRPFEEVHLLALLRSPLCGLTVADFYTLKKGLAEHEKLYELVYDSMHPFFEQLPETLASACMNVQTWLQRWTPFRTAVSLEHQLDELFTETGLRTLLLMQRNGLQKVRNVEKLIAMISANGLLDLETIMTEIEESVLIGDKEGEAEVESVEGDVIQIMTVHASKGLEFPIVCLPHIDRVARGDQGKIRFHADLGLVLDLEPANEEGNKYTTPGFTLVKEEADGEAEEEMKRLFYVAMTRARDYLYMIGEETSSKQTWLTLIKAASEAGLLERLVMRTEESERLVASKKSANDVTIPTLISNAERPITFSVSEIMLFVNDPEAYVNRHLIGLPVQWERKEAGETARGKELLDPTALGTIVHRACELRDYGLAMQSAIKAALEESDISDPKRYEQDVADLMSGYTEERRKQLGEVIVNEWAFAVKIEGVELIGEIDKIVRKDGKLQLIDFKTNQIAASGKELIDYYRPQLYLYKLAYEELMGERIDSVALYVLRDKSEPLHLIEAPADYENELRKVIRAMKLLYKEQKQIDHASVEYFFPI